MLWRPAGFWNMRDLDLADLLRLRLAGLDDRDRAIGADGDADLVLGDRDLGIQQVAIGGHERAFPVHVEIAVARIGHLAVGLDDLEESLSLDHHIQGTLGR